MKKTASDLTMINLNWGSFEYLNMKQEWEWTVATFIAALGGSIGMWLGLSILSLIQVHLLFLFLPTLSRYCCWGKKLHRQANLAKSCINSDEIELITNVMS